MVEAYEFERNMVSQWVNPANNLTDGCLCLRQNIQDFTKISTPLPSRGHQNLLLILQMFFLHPDAQMEESHGKLQGFFEEELRGLQEIKMGRSWPSSCCRRASSRVAKPSWGIFTAMQRGPSIWESLFWAIASTGLRESIGYLVVNPFYVFDHECEFLQI
ncbi:hypothetical protein OUZ56_032938 [Daphnia magna]|uniref:Uncharacterized protein n=1 Tax=Daphnia magna TaxID=35525 RepID=A0ABQ9ZX96_9CRUS|nr:hypothetical protein OUZ56_032938 [Daphnia magna]